jgi:hypothetical protein
MPPAVFALAQIENGGIFPAVQIIVMLPKNIGTM